MFSKGFEMGKVDKTFSLLRQGDDILYVQVHVDDIVFGGSSQSLVARFADDMSKEFEMSMMGELQFFLGLQIKQVKEGTIVHQAKYTDILKKFKMDDSKPLSTPMSTTTVLDADEDGEPVDQKEFLSMIGSLLYLTATRLDIQFSVCLCTCFQVSPRNSHRQAVKRIFRYLRYTPELGLWYLESDMTMPNTPPSIPTTSNKMEHLSSQAAPVHVFDGPITRGRAKKLHQEVHALLCEIPVINENYILPKSCIFLLLSFTKEDD
jgi:hypothetical protein